MISRREAIRISGSTLAGLSLGVLNHETALAQAAAAQEAWPDSLVERPRREGFPVPLPLNPDGSAPEHQASEAGPPPIQATESGIGCDAVAGRRSVLLSIAKRCKRPISIGFLL